MQLYLNVRNGWKLLFEVCVGEPCCLHAMLCVFDSVTVERTFCILS